jgi:hypothetical protein
MSEPTIQSLSREVANLKSIVCAIQLTNQKYDKNRFSYNPYKPYLTKEEFIKSGRLMNRNEILTLLLRLSKTENELRSTRQYKQMLINELAELKYAGVFNYNQVLLWFEKNNIQLLPFNDDMDMIRSKILRFVEDREIEYQLRRNGKSKEENPIIESKVDL